MSDWETISRLDKIIEQQAIIGREVIRALQALETNQKERMVEERMGPEPEEEKESKAEPIREIKPRQKWVERRVPRQEPEPEAENESFEEREDVQEISPEEYRESEAKQKRVL